MTVVAVLPVHHEGMVLYRGSDRLSLVEWIDHAFHWGRPRRVVVEVGSSESRMHLALRAVAAARPVAVWSPVAISQGPAAVLVAWGLLTTKVRHPVHHLGVDLLTTKVPHLAVALRLGLVAVYLLWLGLVAVVPCLGSVVAVASRPFRVRLGAPVVALGLAVRRRRRGAPRVGT